MSANTNTAQPNTGTQQQQKYDKEKLENARENLDVIDTGRMNINIIEHNKMRKKLKRWFDRCTKIECNDALPGKFCYKIVKQNDSDYVILGKKKLDNSYYIPEPFLVINTKNGYVGIQTEKEKFDIKEMNYDEFYKYYKEVVGRNSFLSFFENVYDGFMSATQVPQQWLYQNPNKAKSGGQHAANIATRVFSPVIATGYGLYAGAKALKDKLIPTEEKLNRMKKDEEEKLYKEYTKTTNKDLNELQKGLINNWISGNMRGMHYNDIKRTLDSNQKIYGNPPKQDLNTINNQNLLQNPQNVN